MNRDNLLLSTLGTEQDILDRIVAALDRQSVISLEITCRKSRAIFRQFCVWERLVGRWMADTGIQCHWSARMNILDYQEILFKLENLELTWSTGPLRSSSISMKEGAVDIAMDETSFVVATISGKLIKFSRHSNKEQLRIKTGSRNIDKLGLSEAFILSGHSNGR